LLALFFTGYRKFYSILNGYERFQNGSLTVHERLQNDAGTVKQRCLNDQIEPNGSSNNAEWNKK